MSRIRPPFDRANVPRSDQRRGSVFGLLLAFLLSTGLVVLLATAAPAVADGTDDGVEIDDHNDDDVEIDGVTVEPSETGAGESETHAIEFSVNDVNETGTVTIEFPTAFGDGGTGAIGGVEEISVDGDPVADHDRIDNEVTFNLDVDGASEDVDVVVTIELTHPRAVGEREVTVTVESREIEERGTDTLETTVNPRYLVDGEPRTLVVTGQTVTVAGLEPDGEYYLVPAEEGDSSFVLPLDVDGRGTATVDTAEEADLEVGAFYHVVDEFFTPIDADKRFRLENHEIESEFADGTVENAGDDATTTFEVRSDNRPDTHPVNVSAGGALDAEELYRIFTDGRSPADIPRNATPSTLDEPPDSAVELYHPDVHGSDDRIVLWLPARSNDVPVTFDGVDPTRYDFEVRAHDTDATDTASVTVEEADLGGSFGQETYTSPAGDLVEISADLGEVDSGYVIVGGDRLSDPDVPTGYLDVLYVEGSPTITVNTRLIGTDADSDEVYASDGTVVSYAHEYGPNARAAETEAFSDLRFEDADGNVVADDLAGFRSAAKAGRPVGPLIPQRYRLTVGNGDAIVIREDGVVEPKRAFARSHLVLTEPEFREEIEVYTTMSGPASEDEAIGDVLDDGLERTNVTEGDRLVLGFEATGIWGALTYLADEETVYDDRKGNVSLLNNPSGTGLLDRNEGVSLSIRRTNPGRNERRATLDLADASADDVSLLFDDPDELENLGDGPTIGAFYLVIDTRGNAFTDDLSPGDEFEVEFAFEGDEGDRYRFDRSGSTPPAPFDAESEDDHRIDQQFPYWLSDEAGVNATATFRIREERLEYDQTTADGDLLVSNGGGATISGNTTMHPATELEAELISDAGPTPTVSSSDVEVNDDGTFSIDADFSDLEPGQRVIFELYDAGGLYDSRSVVVVTDPDEPFSFGIENASERVTVTEGDTLGNLTATVQNEGDIRGTGHLELDVDEGSLVADERVRLFSDRSETIRFDDVVVDVAPGEYSYTLSVEDAEASGTLIVEAAPDVSDEEAAGEKTTGDADDADEGGADADMEAGEDGADSSPAADGADAPSAADGADDENGTDDAHDDEDGTDDAHDDENDDDEDGADDESPAIPLPFGVGTREALGGTSIVGATYILGHWV